MKKKAMDFIKKHKKFFYGLLTCVILVGVAVLLLDYNNYIDIKNGRSFFSTGYMGKTADEIEAKFGPFDIETGYSNLLGFYRVCGYQREVQSLWNRNEKEICRFLLFFDDEGKVFETTRIVRTEMVE